MNTQSNNSTLEIIPGPQPDTEDQKPLHRKIAKLPKPLRDLINTMLDDGHSAPEVVARLVASTDPPLPYSISEQNIYDWKHSGYQRYLARQDYLASVQINREDAHEMATAGDTATLPEATLQMISSQYFEFLRGFNPDVLKQKLADDPLKYTRFLNVFSRVTREIMNIRKYRDTAAVAQPTGPVRAPTAEEICNSFLTGFEKVTGIKPAAGPIGPDINHILDPNGSALAAPEHRAGGIPSPGGEGQGEGERNSVASIHQSNNPAIRSDASAPASSLAAPEHRAGGPAAPACRAEASERRRKSDEGGPAAPKSDEGGCCSTSSHTSSHTLSPYSSAPIPSPDGQPVSSVPSDKPSQASPSPVPRDPHPAVTPLSLDQSKIKNQKSKMNNASPTAAQPAPFNLQPATELQSQIENQKSKINEELCYSCAVPLPPLKPDGTRPSPSCPGCHIRLHPPGTTFDHCPSCNAYQANHQLPNPQLTRRAREKRRQAHSLTHLLAHPLTLFLPPSPPDLRPDQNWQSKIKNQKSKIRAPTPPNRNPQTQSDLCQ